jgi:segregation and condensation protein B
LDEHVGPAGPQGAAAQAEQDREVNRDGQVSQIGEAGQLGEVGQEETARNAAEPEPGSPAAELPQQEAQVAQTELRVPSPPIPEAEGLEIPDPESPAPEPEVEGPASDVVEHEAQSLEADVLAAEALSPDIENFEAPRRRSAELKAILEALIFASPDPLTPKAIFKLLDNEPQEDVLAAVAELKQDYERPGGLQLVEIAGGLQIVTRSDLHEWVRRLFHERSSQKLSAQALETLAVIAYRQSVTAAEITDIRGVNTSGVLNTLLERHLIKIVGRKQVVGRPFMYSTTKEFLIRFGLNDLSDLPKVEDMAEALGIENPLLVELAPREDLLPLAEPEIEAEAEATAPGGAAAFAASDEEAAADRPDGADDPDDPDAQVH